MIARLRRAAAGRRARWEALCLRCGKCCYEKEIKGFSTVTNYRRPCLHLDTSTRLCTVYKDRLAVCPQCRRMTLRHALFVRWLPDGCGYVQRFRFRRAAAKGSASFETGVAGCDEGG
jgi:uncharacterized protein